MVDIMLAHVHRRSKLTLGLVVLGLLMGSDSHQQSATATIYPGIHATFVSRSIAGIIVTADYQHLVTDTADNSGMECKCVPSPGGGGQVLAP